MSRVGIGIRPPKKRALGIVDVNVLYRLLSRLKDDRKENADAMMRSNSAKSTMLSRQSSRGRSNAGFADPREDATVGDGSACGHRSKSRPAFSKHKPTYHYLRGPTPVATTSGNWHL
jgi:hypothetical protein